MWGLETKLRSELKLVHRKRALQVVGVVLNPHIRGVLLHLPHLIWPLFCRTERKTE